jgi:uncharacterized membrane protein YeaQ/YmgE (transglycosylase-associated protein family)
MFSDVWNILILLLVGFLAGVVANAIMGRRSNSALMDIILGVAGAFVGGWLLSLVGIYTFGFIGTLISAIIGAVVLIWLVSFLTGNKRRIRF